MVKVYTLVYNKFPNVLRPFPSRIGPFSTSHGEHGNFWAICGRPLTENAHFRPAFFPSRFALYASTHCEAEAVYTSIPLTELWGTRSRLLDIVMREDVYSSPTSIMGANKRHAFRGGRARHISVREKWHGDR